MLCVSAAGPQLGTKEGEEGRKRDQPGFKSHFLKKNKQNILQQILLWWDDFRMCVQYQGLSVAVLRICCFICGHLVFNLCDKQH